MTDTMLGEPTSTEPQAPPAQAEPTTTEASKAPEAEATPTTEQEQPKAESPKTAAPEKYEFKAPEGSAFDAEVMTAYEGAARELGLSQEAAQKMLDAVAPKVQERQEAQVEAIRQQWVEQAQSDKEFGGDKLKANLAVAKSALDRFGTPELRQMLNDSGLGNHPELIRAFFRAGRAIAEDSFVSGAQRAAPEADIAKRMYPNMA